MASFGQLIDDTAAQLRSFTRDQELSTWLTSDVSDSATEIFVNSPDVLSRGRIEIDSELIILEDVDVTRKVGVIPPFGRGSDGTAPAIHAAKSKVTVAPLFPRKVIHDTLNQVILAMSGRMFGVDTLPFRASTTRVSYELPWDTQKVLSVSIPTDPSITRDRWYAREWTFDPNADYPSEKGLYVYDCPPVGRLFNVVISRPLRAVDVETQSFNDSLLPDSSWDVVMFGAAARLIATAGTYQMNTRAVGSQTTLGAQMDLPQAAMNTSRHFYGLYEKRLEEEVMKLLNKYVTRAHYSREY